MKFHRIDIQNINSLYGDNPIDLDGHFADVPLYLIMGPTGSGKTTIMDAVCLALFGTTPRQTHTRSTIEVGDEVNSKGTGRSRAEVVFSVLDAAQGGRTHYRAVWEFWRAHDQPYGNPQRPRRELHERDSNGEWTVLVSSDKEKEYAPHFERVLGEMTLQDFLRSVMLAQGEFAALLKADESEKASILERLTDTSVYLRLGRKAHEKWREARDKLARLDDRVDTFEGASAEDIAATEERLTAKKSDYAGLEAWRDAAAERRQWLERHARLTEELAAAKKALTDAQQNKKENAAAFARRDADQRVGPARAPLREVRRLEGELDSLDETIPKLRDDAQAHKSALTKANEAEKKAKAKLAEVLDAFQEIKPEIEAAKAIKNSLAGVRKRVKRLDEKVATRAKALKAARAQVQSAASKVETCETACTAVADKLETIADDAGLHDALIAIRPELEALHKLEERVHKADKKLRKIDEDLSQKREQIEQLDEALAAKNDALEPLQKAVEQAKARLADNLGEAERPRERYDQIAEQVRELTRRRDALGQLVEQVDDHRAKRDALDERAKQLKSVEEQLAAANESLEGIKTKRDDLKAAIDAHKADIEKVGQNLLAAELRRTLEADMACPVCGGTDHPRVHEYGAEALDAQEKSDKERRAELEEQLNSLRVELAEVVGAFEAKEKRVDALTLEVARLSTSREAAKTALDTVSDTIEKTAASVGESIADVDLFADGARDGLDAVAEALDEKLDTLDRAKTELNAAEDALEKAQSQLEEARTDIDDVEEKRKALALSVENLASNRKSANGELDDIHRDFELDRDDLLEAFDCAGVQVVRDDEGNPDFAAAMDRAQKREAAFQKAKHAVETAEEALAKAAQAHADAKSARGVAEEQLAEATDERDAVKQEVNDLEEKLRAKLGGRDPDEVQKKHDERVASARRAREAAGEARQEAEKAAQKASDALTHTTERRTTVADALKGARAQLDEVIATIDGVCSVEEVEAAVLADDERERLHQACGTIETALRDAKRDIERLENDLGEHTDSKPDDFAPQLYSLETLTRAQEQLDQALVTYNQAIGALRTELEQMRDRVQKHATLIAERDAQREEFEEWNELNTLIGVGNGERFKQFAQALNLDRIVERANRRLEELHPRYRLKTQHDAASGMPTLNFEIVDTYHADQTRPLSTLSGGETFLVSLALALALADQQQIKMPIETLFLDEGFGTLDRNALHNSITILNELHARAGRTVGVISHVEALQEQINSHIIVKPQQDGRSTIVIEQT